MNKKFLYGILIVFVVSVVALIGAIAYKGNPDVQGPNYNADVHEQLETAIENGNYDEWIRIRTENNLPMHGRMFQAINADNFHKFSEMHEAMEEGDYDDGKHYQDRTRSWTRQTYRKTRQYENELQELSMRPPGLSSDALHHFLNPGHKLFL